MNPKSPRDNLSKFGHSNFYSFGHESPSYSKFGRETGVNTPITQVDLKNIFDQYVEYVKFYNKPEMIAIVPYGELKNLVRDIDELKKYVGKVDNVKYDLTDNDLISFQWKQNKPDLYVVSPYTFRNSYESANPHTGNGISTMKALNYFNIDRMNVVFYNKITLVPMIELLNENSFPIISPWNPAETQEAKPNAFLVKNKNANGYEYYIVNNDGNGKPIAYEEFANVPESVKESFGFYNAEDLK